MTNEEYLQLKAELKADLERARKATPEEARRVLIERGFLTVDGKLPVHYQQPAA